MIKSNISTIGVSSELIAQQYFIQQEYNVCVPLRHVCRFDFVIHKDNKYSKIQVKSTRSERIRFFTTPDAGVINSYTSDDVDYFFVIFYKTMNAYVLPFDYVDKNFTSARESTLKKNKEIKCIDLSKEMFSQVFEE